MPSILLLIPVSLKMNYVPSTANITHITLNVPHYKKGHCLDRTRTLLTFLGNTSYANIATDDDSIFTFNTAVANLAAQHAQDNAAMSHLSETNQSMQSNLTTIMQELQSIEHQIDHNATHKQLRHNDNGLPSSIYTAQYIQPNLPPSPPANPLLF